MKRDSNFYKPTLKFAIAGIFIPGFTLAPILGLQMGLVWLGVECTNAWTIVLIVTAIGMIAAPLILVRLMYKRLLKRFDLSVTAITIFNFIEYAMIQTVLGVLVSDTHTLCYVTDGQNGLQFFYIGWVAIPVLILLSRAFDLLRRDKIWELISEREATETIDETASS